jgi:large subunit ribosomal protein L16
MSGAGAKRWDETLMLSPKRSKYRKAHKGRVHGLAKGGTTLNFGAYGLKAADPGRITARQIEAARRAITRHIRRAGRVWIRVFPDVPVSPQPAEVRMGSGKGSPEFWICRVKPGRIMFELDGVTLTVAREAFELAAAKLPIAARFVVRQGEDTG